MPKIIQTVLSPKYRVALGGEAPYSKIASVADYALNYVLLGLCVLITLIFVTDLPRRGGFALIALLAPWAFMVVRDLYVPVKPSEAAIAYPLVIIAIWIVQPRLCALRWLAYVVGAVGMISLVLAILQPSHAIFQTQAGDLLGEDKQVIPLGVLVGIFSQGNLLGQFLVTGGAAVILVPHRGTRLAIFSVTALALLWSASRGALIASAVGVLAYVVLRYCSVGARPILAWVMPIVGFVVVAVVPFVTTDPLAFSNRGLIWTLSLRAWADEPWAGLGINWYDVIGSSSARIAGSARHGHNQVVQLLVTGGVVMVLLVGQQIAIVIARSARLAAEVGNLFGTVWVVVLAASGLFERTLTYVDNPNFLVTVTLVMAFLLFCNEPAGAGTSTIDSPRAVGTPSDKARASRRVSRFAPIREAI